MKRLFVDKASGTFADPLAAFGLAVVMRDILRKAYDDRDISVLLSDRGGYYQLELERALDDACLARIQGPYMPPTPVIVTVKNAASMPAGLPAATCLSYEEQRDRVRQFWQLYNGLSAEAKRAWRAKEPGEVSERLSALAPHSHWDILRAINPGALAGYNKLVLQWWQIQPTLAEVIALIRDLYARTPNDVGGAQEGWKKLAKAHSWGISAETTCLQIFNPSQGKGQNSPKPDRLAMNNTSGFWIEEFLKAVGYFVAAVTKQPSGTKDRKTYVLAPAELDLSEHERVFAHFRDALIGDSAVRLDILVSLRYLQELLVYAFSEEGVSIFSRLMGLKRVRLAVGGFSGALYKSLGNSQATMNVPFLGLPAWVQTRTREEIADMQRALQEQIDVVRQFDESHGDEMNLLLAYRDFSVGGGLEAFFDFAVLYSGFIIQRRERNRYARQFSEENLRRLIMGTEPKLQPILDTPGFQHIAYAIRQSTVVAQLRKQQGDRRYDVRYGLGAQLARKAHYATDFIAELSEFLHEFNAENAQVMETRPGPYRRSVRVEDIEDIVRLIDTYGSRTVAQLLIAYGYARTGVAPATGAEGVPVEESAPSDASDALESED